MQPKCPFHAVPFLCPVGRADRTVHVQCDVLQPFAVMHRVNPLSRQIRKCRAIIIHCQNLSLKPPHLARGCCLFINSPSAHNLGASPDRALNAPRH